MTDTTAHGGSPLPNMSLKSSTFKSVLTGVRVSPPRSSPPPPRPPSSSSPHTTDDDDDDDGPTNDNLAYDDVDILDALDNLDSCDDTLDSLPPVKPCRATAVSILYKGAQLRQKLQGKIMGRNL